MPNAFQPISLVIDVDFEYTDPSPLVLRHPAKHRPVTSRIVLHETIHYWQHLSQGFLVRMAEEDYGRLTTFESTGEAPEPGPYRNEYLRRDTETGLCARDLHECLARYWDMHVLGPPLLIELEFQDPRRNHSSDFVAGYHKLKDQGLIISPIDGGYSDISYDMAMTAAAGNYGKPYLMLREMYPSVVAAGLFPLAGYCAMMTDNPLLLFKNLISTVAPAFFDIRPHATIEDVWESRFGKVMRMAVQLARTDGGSGLDFGITAYQESTLHQEYPHGWLHHTQDMCIKLLQNSKKVREIEANGKQFDKQAVAWADFNFILACPGVPNNRSFLCEWLAPPCVRFSNGKTWTLGELHRRELVPELDDFEKGLSAEKQRVATEAQSLDERWRAFRKARRGY